MTPVSNDGYSPGLSAKSNGTEKGEIWRRFSDPQLKFFVLKPAVISKLGALLKSNGVERE